MYVCSEARRLLSILSHYALRLGDALIGVSYKIIWARRCTSPMMIRPNPHRPGTFNVVDEVYLLDLVDGK